MSDATLLRASRQDADAFDALYARAAAPIWRYFRRRTQNSEASTDLTAETFARAWLLRGRFAQDATEAMPWLYGIGRYVLLESVRKNHLERDATERLGLAGFLDRPASLAHPDPAWLIEIDALDDILDDLPAKQRDALSLRYGDDLAYDEIGRRLGISSVGARTRVSRGLAALRRRHETL